MEQVGTDGNGCYLTKQMKGGHRKAESEAESVATMNSKLAHARGVKAEAAAKVKAEAAAAAAKPVGYIRPAFIVLSACAAVFFALRKLRRMVTTSPHALIRAFNRWIAPECHNDAVLSEPQQSEVFPQGALLEENWRVIRSECEKVMKDAVVYGSIDPVQSAAALRGSWRVFYLRYMGRDIAEGRARCPRTAELLDACCKQRPGGAIRNAFFSILEPHTRLCAHRGVIQAVLRYHLGLLVPHPDLCSLHVDAQHLHWKEGEGILWDDMYEHWAENRSDVPRVVLFLDVVRPGLSLGARAADALMVWCIQQNEHFRNALNRLEASSTERS
jgi:aspartyl/asparaginyl beta-hydroxylase (cupin superfamily)